MKICMITTSEVFHDSRILNETKSLSKKYKVTILARRYPNQKNQKLPFKIKLVNFWHLPIFQLNIISSIFSLIKAAFKEKSDIYHAHDLDGLLCAFPAALIKRKILIYDSHELWSNTFPFANLRGIQWLLPILEKFLILKVKAGITVNVTIAKYLKARYHKNFLALYNVINIDQPKKSPYNLRRLFPNKKIILHLGAADEGRGMEEMIETIKYLSRDYVLVFIGGGKTENQAKILVKKFDLEKKVYFLSAVLPNQIIDTIQQADLGLALTQKISLSYYYSLPNKIFQYIAAKIPVLGSNFPEFKKIIINNGIGEVVDPSKPKLIAKKIIEMTTQNAQKKYRKNLEGLAKDKYNWANQEKILHQFYLELW